MKPQFRQGDVLLTAAEMSPYCSNPVRPKGDRVVLAEGELTGHAHAFLAKYGSLYREPLSNRSFVRVTADGARLRHEEHREIPLPQGFYELRRQREYMPEKVRLVAD